MQSRSAQTQEKGPAPLATTPAAAGAQWRLLQQGSLALVAAVVALESLHMVQAPAVEGAIATVILLSALLSSIAGFAFAALAGSGLAHLGLEPVQAVAMMAMCSIATQAYAVWRLRASIRWRALWPLLGAGAVTTPMGVALLVHIDARLYAAILGAIVVGYGGYVLVRRQARVLSGTTLRDALVGALSGLVGGLTGAPGLCVTIWCSMRGWDKVQQRAVYQPFILAMQMLTLAWLGGAAHARHALADASFVPFALLGAMAGFALFRRLTTPQFHAVVSLLLITSGIGLLARAL